MVLSRNCLSLTTILLKHIPYLHKFPLIKFKFHHFNRFNAISQFSLLITTTKMGCSTSKVKVSRSDSTSHDEDIVEDVVCKDSDIKENEMKAFDLQDAGKVLLVRQNGKLSALGAKCCHYGAPLANGVLGNGRIRCQWHGACFNIETGDIEDFPGLDSLPCYQVTVKNGEVKVRAHRCELESNKRVKHATKRDRRETQSIVVIGGGPAGATCVEALRQEGFAGQISLICKEPHLPYDRIKVSKAMDFEIEKSQFRDDQFYAEHDIDVYKGVEANAVDTTGKLVTLSDGKQLKFDRLFIATGLRAVKVPIPGADLANVIVLRNYEDAHTTNALLTEEKEVVVLGSSFVGMEAANYCVNKVSKVTVVARDSVPFKPVLGERIGSACLKLFNQKGVNFIMNSGLKRCIDNSGHGKVTAVELLDGTTIRADLVIMGVGGQCQTEFLKTSDVKMTDRGALEVNEYLETNIKNIYAGGDIALAPVWSRDDMKSQIGHWPLAHYHGKMAALNMLGKMRKMEVVPYFWTMLFGKGIRYAGHGSFDDIYYEGDVEELKFVAYYLYNDEVIAISSCGMDPIVSQFAELKAQGKKLMRNDVTEGEPMAWTRKLYSN